MESRRQSGVAGGALELCDAVVMTLAYADIFDFALTRREIHRDLIGVPADAGEIQTTLDTLVRDGVLVVDSDLVVLSGREGLVPRRHGLRERAATLWPVARRIGRLLGGLPFVRLVAVTGSLAAENPGPGADLDYLLVTTPGHLWTVRALAIAVVRLGRRVGIEVCPNYLLTTNALRLDRRDLFTAHELLQAVPVAGRATFAQFRAANRWARLWLPNRWDASGPDGPDRRPPAPLRRLGEWVLDGKFGKRLEVWERDRKSGRLASADRWGRFTGDVCEGHYGRAGRRARRAFVERCAGLGIPIDRLDLAVLPPRLCDVESRPLAPARQAD